MNSNLPMPCGIVVECAKIPGCERSILPVYLLASEIRVRLARSRCSEEHIRTRFHPTSLVPGTFLPFRQMALTGLNLGTCALNEIVHGVSESIHRPDSTETPPTAHRPLRHTTSLVTSKRSENAAIGPLSPFLCWPLLTGSILTSFCPR